MAQKQRQKKTMSPAQVVDSFIQRTALGVVLIAAKYGIGAASPLIPARWEDGADIATVVLSILAVFVVFPPFLRYMQLKRQHTDACVAEDGYMAEMFKRAGMRALSATFVFMIVLEAALSAGMTLPALVALDMVIAVCMGSVGLSFLFMTRDSDDDEDDFDIEEDA